MPFASIAMGQVFFFFFFLKGICVVSSFQPSWLCHQNGPRALSSKHHPSTTNGLFQTQNDFNGHSDESDNDNGHDNDNDETNPTKNLFFPTKQLWNRRSWFQQQGRRSMVMATTTTMMMTMMTMMMTMTRMDDGTQLLPSFSSIAHAMESLPGPVDNTNDNRPSSSFLAGQVTDTIYIDIQGLSTILEDGTITTRIPKRITIGLFGHDAPKSTFMLKQLVSVNGLPAPCKPLQERMLQREQLEAKKVYNNCKDQEEKGVTYDYATIWRVIPHQRIDVGAVAGKFVAREYPTWEEDDERTSAMSNNNDNDDNNNNNNSKQRGLRHDRCGIVSVVRGSESGFGFSIYCPSTENGDDNDALEATELDKTHIVVGQVVGGWDVLQQLLSVPVITSAKVNYMALTGGPTVQSAPSRACRYGGPMYCNENKPLIKLTISSTGLII